MKKVCVTLLICVFLLCCIFYIEFNIYSLSYNKNKKESEIILQVAKSMIKDESTQDVEALEVEDNNSKQIQNAKENIILKDDIIGILQIEKIDVEAPIKDGTSQKVMQTSIGHFTESDYWDGNVALASHNGGTNAHYFKKICELEENDEIIYSTKLGTKKYKVQFIKKIQDTDWTMVTKSTNQCENTITLITCINGQPSYRLCVRGIEI